jgi:hypothetical protein
MSKHLLAIPFALTMGAFVQPESGLPPSAEARDETGAEAVRVRIDLARGRRWVLDWEGLAVHDVATGALIRRVILPGAIFVTARGVAPPDLVLSRSGAALVSSNTVSRLWRVSPERFEVEVYDLALGSDQDKDFGFTSLAWGVGERALLASDSITGSPWRIDLRSASAQKVPADLAVLSK